MEIPPENHPPADDGNEVMRFWLVMGGSIGLAAISFVLAPFLGVSLLPGLKFDPNAIAIGIIAAVPLCLGLYFFMATKHPSILAFRDSQIEFFANIGFRFTLPRILLLAAGAGIGEELLFRGVFQQWLDLYNPSIVAIIFSNVVFGLLHFRSATYAIVAGLVGVYLGMVYLFTDSLLAPIATHAIYDAIALEYTRRAVEQWRQQH